MARITKEELLEKLFHDDYEHLKGKKLRMTRVRVPGKEVCLAHVITPSDTSVYHNLALHIGVHEGEDHTGESIGLIRFTPWEVLRISDPDRRLSRSADRSGGSCAVFRRSTGISYLRDP